MRGENGDGFSDNNISWCKEERGEKEEKEAWLPSPSPSLFPSEEMAAGAASAADALAFMYLLGEPVPNAEEGGYWLGRGEQKWRRERCEEDHHLVPVRLCVFARASLCSRPRVRPLAGRSFPPPPRGWRRRAKRMPS